MGPSDKYGGFEIEHFRPKGDRRFRGLRSVYANLLWTCHACNRAKGDTWPSKEEIGGGMVFVDPCSEALGDHLELHGEEVVAVNASRAGEYMITEINLNSAQHRERRRRRTRYSAAIAAAEAACDAMRLHAATQLPGDPEIAVHLRRMEKSLAELRIEAGDRFPWDCPALCRCDTPLP